MKPKSHNPGNVSTKVVEKENRFMTEEALKRNVMDTPGRDRKNPAALRTQAEHSVTHVLKMKEN